MATDTQLALGCLARTREGYACALGAGRNAAMAKQQSCGGKSILEMLWDALLVQYAELVDMNERPPVDWEERDELNRVKGICLGLGTAIAVITNPYNPNVDAVRAECVTRWEARS